jgi:hypothetical protein
VSSISPLTDEGGGAAGDEVLVFEISDRLADADWDRFNGWSLGIYDVSAFYEAVERLFFDN